MPDVLPNTTPVVGLTLATVGLLDDHVPPVVVEAQVVDVPVQIALVPLSVPADAEDAPTVTVVVATAVPQALVTR